MSGLSNLYSYIDSKKRQIRGLLADPVETINQGLLNFRDDHNATLNLLDNAYQVTPGSKTVLNTPEQVAGFQRTIADKGSQQGVASMFVGKGSKIWDEISAKKAEEMSAAGVSPRVIWSETGNWKGPDGMWRQEIPDNAAKIIKVQDGSLYMGISPQDKLSDVLSHKRLYESYPLGEIGVRQYPGLGASYSPGYTSEKRAIFDKIGVDIDPVLMEQMRFGVNTNKSDVIHELQHAIQQREGWAQGGSPQAMSKAKNKISGVHPEVAYRRLAGEAEARATQARIPLDAAQRRALFPEDSYDVPINQLIIRGLLD